MKTTLDEDIARLSQSIDWIIESRAELIAALNLAVATIRIWHGMGMGPAENEAWFSYQSSPEMKQINAAIAKAEGR
jgi:hypothetical protein